MENSRAARQDAGERFGEGWASSADLHRKRASAKVDAVIGATPWSATANLVNASLLAFAHRNVIEAEAVFGWLAWMVVVVTTRFAVWWLYRHANGDIANHRPWERAMVGLACITGLGWGAAVIIFLPELSPFTISGEHALLQEAITITFAAGMAAGALGSFGPIHAAYRAYVLFTLAPPAIVLAWTPNEPSLILIAALILYLAFLLFSSHRYHTLFDRALAARLEKEAAVQQLTLENQRADTLNRELQQAHEELHQAHRDLERRVADRTSDLRLVVSDLENEIAEREAVERQLVQAQKMDALGKVTGGVAHDFNNLLTVIQGNLEFIRGRMGNSPEVTEFAEKALSAAQRGATLVWRLLAFSGRQPLHAETVDMNAMVNEMKDLLKRTLGETFDIVTETAPDLWPVCIDAAALENALLNLAINARDAMPAGGAVRIGTCNETRAARTRMLDEDVPRGRYVKIWVEDDGKGMPPSVMDQIFEPFFTTKETGKGSGLGLSLVYGLAKQSGGFVNVVSAPGSGTTVTLLFPAFTETATEAAARAAESVADIPRGGETVLVVEDDVDVRDLAANLLTVLGYRVHEAGDGKTATEFLETGQPIDLLFTDLVLPGGMSGRDLARHAVDHCPGVAVLYCSGYSDDGSGPVEEGAELLSKPFGKEELARRVRAALDRRTAAH